MEKAIIFDMDGTLFQTDLILESALEITFDELRKSGLWSEKTPIEKYREIMGVPLPVVWETLCPDHDVEIRDKSNEFFQNQLIQLIKSSRGALYPNTEKVLAALSEKYTLFIASNGQVEYLQAIVDTFGIGRFIKNTYSIQMISSGHKSDLVGKVLQENNIQKGAVVGDRSSDIQAAKDNKLLAVGVNFGFAQESELQNADIIVNDLISLLNLEV